MPLMPAMCWELRSSRVCTVCQIHNIRSSFFVLRWPLSNTCDGASHTPKAVIPKYCLFAVHARPKPFSSLYCSTLGRGYPPLVSCLGKAAKNVAHGRTIFPATCRLSASSGTMCMPAFVQSSPASRVRWALLFHQTLLRLPSQVSQRAECIIRPIMYDQ